MKCKACERKAVDVYCELHGRAYSNLVEKYKAWKRALDISWGEYLREAARNEYSGSWVREVAEQLIKNEEG